MSFYGDRNHLKKKAGCPNFFLKSKATRLS